MNINKSKIDYYLEQKFNIEYDFNFLNSYDKKKDILLQQAPKIFAIATGLGVVTGVVFFSPSEVLKIANNFVLGQASGFVLGNLVCNYSLKQKLSDFSNKDLDDMAMESYNCQELLKGEYAKIFKSFDNKVENVKVYKKRR